MSVSLAAPQQRPHSVLSAPTTTATIIPTITSEAVLAEADVAAECTTPPCMRAAQGAMSDVPPVPHTTQQPSAPAAVVLTTTSNSSRSTGNDRKAGQAQRRMSGAWEKGSRGSSSSNGSPPLRRGSMTPHTDHNSSNTNSNNDSARHGPAVNSLASARAVQQQRQQEALQLHHNNNNVRSSSSSRRGSTSGGGGGVATQSALTSSPPRPATNTNTDTSNSNVGVGAGRRRPSNMNMRRSSRSSSRRGSEAKPAALQPSPSPSLVPSARPSLRPRGSGTWDVLPEQHYEAPGSPIQLRPLRYLKQHGQPMAPPHQSMAPVFRQTLSPADLALLEPGLHTGSRSGNSNNIKDSSTNNNNSSGTASHDGYIAGTASARQQQQQQQGEAKKKREEEEAMRGKAGQRAAHTLTTAAIYAQARGAEGDDANKTSAGAAQMQREVWAGPQMREELRATTPSSHRGESSPRALPSHLTQGHAVAGPIPSHSAPIAAVVVRREGRVPSQTQSETRRNVQATEDEAEKIHRAVAALVGRSSEAVLLPSASSQQQQKQQRGSSSLNVPLLAGSAPGITTTSKSTYLPQLRQPHKTQPQQAQAVQRAAPMIGGGGSSTTAASYSVSRQQTKASTRVEAMPPLLTAPHTAMAHVVPPSSQVQHQPPHYGMPSPYRAGDGVGVGGGGGQRLYGHMRGTASASASSSINSLRDILRREPQQEPASGRMYSPSAPHSGRHAGAHNYLTSSSRSTNRDGGGGGGGVQENGNDDDDVDDDTLAPRVVWTADITPQWISTPLPRVLAVPAEGEAGKRNSHAAAAAAGVVAPALPMPHVLPTEEEMVEEDGEGGTAAAPRPAQRRRPAARGGKGNSSNNNNKRKAAPMREQLQQREDEEREEDKTRQAARAGRPPRPLAGTAKPTHGQPAAAAATPPRKSRRKGNASSRTHSESNTSRTDAVCAQHMPPLLPMYASHTDISGTLRRTDSNINTHTTTTNSGGGGVLMRKMPIAATSAAAVNTSAASHTPHNDAAAAADGGNGGVGQGTRRVLPSLPMGSAAARYAQYTASREAARSPHRMSHTPPTITPAVLLLPTSSGSSTSQAQLQRQAGHGDAAAVTAAVAAAVRSSSSSAAAAGVGHSSNNVTGVSASRIRLPLVLRRSSLLSITGSLPITSTTLLTPKTTTRTASRSTPCGTPVLPPALRGHQPHGIRRPLSFHAPQDEADGVLLVYTPHKHDNSDAAMNERHKGRRVTGNVVAVSRARQRSPHVLQSLVHHNFSMYTAAAPRGRRSRHGGASRLPRAGQQQQRRRAEKARHVLPGHTCAEEARAKLQEEEEDVQRDRYAYLLTQHGFWGESTRCL